MLDKITFIIWLLCVIKGVGVCLFVCVFVWVVLYLNSMFVVISDKSHDDDEEATTNPTTKIIKSIYFLLGKSFMFSTRRDFCSNKKKDFHFNPLHKKIPLTV